MEFISIWINSLVLWVAVMSMGKNLGKMAIPMSAEVCICAERVWKMEFCDKVLGIWRRREQCLVVVWVGSGGCLWLPWVQCQDWESVLCYTGRGITYLSVGCWGRIVWANLLFAVESARECVLSTACCPLLLPCQKGNHTGSGFVIVLTELVCRHSPSKDSGEGNPVSCPPDT